MPCLQFISESLNEHLGVEGLQVARFGGVLCPVYLLQGEEHVHQGNGVYISVKVYIYLIFIPCIYISYFNYNSKT